MKVAVTGATGYLGRHLVAALRERQHDVVVLCRTPPIGLDAEHLPFDLNEKTLVSDDFTRRGITALVHCAWDFRPRRREDVDRINVLGAERLVQAARGLRLIDISTMSAFPGCRSVYGRAKLAVEEIVLQAGGRVFRPGLIWGPDAGGMMANLDRLAHLPVAPVIAGGGKLYLVHVEDLAARVTSTLEDNNFTAGISTIAHPTPFSLREIIAAQAGERRPILIPVPWLLIWLGLRGLETISPNASLRSDSVIGLVCANPAPHFDSTAQLLRPFGD